MNVELKYAQAPYILGNTEIDFSKETVVMGILNVTPDSFSDGGKYNYLDAAVEKAAEMLKDGAKIIDIGGESTRPGHTPVTLDEELSRTIPVIEVLSKELNCVISIDTYKASVAEEAIKAGAHIINDVWGAKREPRIVEVAKKYDAPIILMHNRFEAIYEGNLGDELIGDIEESISLARNAGVVDRNIWLDPGIGFAKNIEENIEAMQNLDRLAALGHPVLLGTSRKSLIGKVLDLPVEERLEGTGATVCYGIEHGCHIVRVHDVKAIARMVRMMDVLTGKQEFMI